MDDALSRGVAFYSNSCNIFFLFCDSPFGVMWPRRQFIALQVPNCFFHLFPVYLCQIVLFSISSLRLVLAFTLDFINNSLLK